MHWRELWVFQAGGKQIPSVNMVQMPMLNPSPWLEQTVRSDNFPRGGCACKVLVEVQCSCQIRSNIVGTVE